MVLEMNVQRIAEQVENRHSGESRNPGLFDHVRALHSKGICSTFALHLLRSPAVTCGRCRRRNDMVLEVVTPARAGVQLVDFSGSALPSVACAAMTEEEQAYAHLKGHEPTCRPGKRRPGGQAGFTFIGLLFMVALAGIAIAGTGILWHMEGRREKELELLFIGEEYRNAIGNYHDKSPGEAKLYPEKLEDLLQDKRFPTPLHHLRRLYPDPMTGQADWTLIRHQERITGIASRSLDKPIKIAGFLPVQEDFASTGHYADWRFLSGSDRPSSSSATAPKTDAPGPVLPGK